MLPNIEGSNAHATKANDYGPEIFLECGNEEIRDQFKERKKQLQYVDILGIIKLRLRPKALQGIVNSLVIMVMVGGLGLMPLSGCPVGQQREQTKFGMPGYAFVERNNKNIYFAKTFELCVLKF